MSRKSSRYEDDIGSDYTPSFSSIFTLRDKKPAEKVKIEPVVSYSNARIQTERIFPLDKKCEAIRARETNSWHRFWRRLKYGVVMSGYACMIFYLLGTKDYEMLMVVGYTLLYGIVTNAVWNLFG